MKRSNLILFVFSALTLAVLAVGKAFAQQSTPPPQPVTDDQVNTIAHQLYCPVCENIPLDACGTAACEQWRGLIRDMLEQGKSGQEIKNYFAQQYGDRVLGAPPARGINWLVYIIPPVAILIGAFVLFRAFQEWRKPPKGAQAASGQPPGPPPQDEAYVQRLEEELRKR
jgi:cytochrome c-type biogenesis protein CcmH